jgi:hypothetical protein
MFFENREYPITSAEQYGLLKGLSDEGAVMLILTDEQRDALEAELSASPAKAPKAAAAAKPAKVSAAKAARGAKKDEKTPSDDAEGDEGSEGDESSDEDKKLEDELKSDI